MPETGQSATISSTMAPASKRSPTQGGFGDTHAAKAARIEAAVSQGLPSKIEEEAEPGS